MLLQASCSTALPLYVYTATIVPFSAFILMVDLTVSGFFGLDSEELLYLWIISCSHSDHSCTMISLLSSSLCIIRFLTKHIALELFLLHCQSNRRLIFKKNNTWIPQQGRDGMRCAWRRGLESKWEEWKWKRKDPSTCSSLPMSMAQRCNGLQTCQCENGGKK